MRFFSFCRFSLFFLITIATLGIMTSFVHGSSIRDGSDASTTTSLQEHDTSEYPIQIFISGSFSVGKTTLARHLYNALTTIFPPDRVVMIEEVLTKYFPDERDEKETPETPIKITRKYIELGEEAMKKNPAIIIYDRCPMGTWCYRNFFQKGKPLTPEQRVVREAGEKHFVTHGDLLLFLRPGDAPLVQDGFRSTSDALRVGVDEEYAQMIEEMRSKYGSQMPPVVELSFESLCAHGSDVVYDPLLRVLRCCGNMEILIRKKTP